MKSFREIVFEGGLPITLEVPLIRRREQLAQFIDSFREYGLDRWVVGINTLNNPMGSLSSDPVITGFLIQSELGIEAIPHISVSLENAYTLARWLLGASLHNINNLLLLGGDIKLSGSISFKEALGLVKGFSRGLVRIGDSSFEVGPKKFFVGGALLPDRDGEHNRVLFKLRHGVEFFQTQIVFSSRRLRRVLQEVGASLDWDVTIPVLVSVSPYLDEKIVRLFGSHMEGVDESILNSNDHYLSLIEGVLKELMDFCDSNDHFRMGIHFIPIVWKDESIVNMCELIDRC